ncbi:gluconate 2-dehydrogenase subunit 3 family protein [Sphingobium chlorophenolicum]|uniref:gluconate 2-dehydrogenase subunit 3 family protein n=1 Tax=Sphingobium chlorophenolicum TaxID=46429 RepID=UPI0002EF339F|nr:gluconate 2-dehydrogenase subunit 3 family protein [Sphingobium chlorophenolicum]
MLNRRDAILGLATVAMCASLGIYGFRALSEEGEDSDDREKGLHPPLTSGEVALIAAMAEGIIPPTETPGAIAAGVPAFISKIFSDWFKPEEQRDFRTGLRKCQDLAKTRHGLPFERCSAAQQHDLLVALDEEAMNAPRPAGKIPAFVQFKALTVIGYYSSEAGQNEELKSQMNAGEQTPNGPTFLSAASFGNII